jgi:hypothetical protein
MPSLSGWKIPSSVQPKPEDYRYDLIRLIFGGGVRTVIPGDAFTAETLGTERTGNGVRIRADGLVLTIGYIITEAETVWLTLIDGRAVPSHALSMISDRLRTDPGACEIRPAGVADRPIERSSLGEQVTGVGGRQRSVAAKIVGRQNSPLREYVLDEAMFVSPASTLGRDRADRADGDLSVSDRCNSNKRAKAARASTSI